MTTKNIEQKPQPPQWVLSLINTEDATEMLEIVNNQLQIDYTCIRWISF